MCLLPTPFALQQVCVTASPTTVMCDVNICASEKGRARERGRDREASAASYVWLCLGCVAVFGMRSCVCIAHGAGELLTWQTREPCVSHAWATRGILYFSSICPRPPPLPVMSLWRSPVSLATQSKWNRAPLPGPPTSAWNWRGQAAPGKPLCTRHLTTPHSVPVVKLDQLSSQTKVLIFTTSLYFRQILACLNIFKVDLYQITFRIYPYIYTDKNMRERVNTSDSSTTHSITIKTTGHDFSFLTENMSVQ